MEWLKSMHIKNDNLNITDFLHQAEKVEALIFWKELIASKFALFYAC